jgi:hypothetical protein
MEGSKGRVSGVGAGTMPGRMQAECALLCTSMAGDAQLHWVHSFCLSARQPQDWKTAARVSRYASVHLLQPPVSS